MYFRTKTGVKKGKKFNTKPIKKTGSVKNNPIAFRNNIGNPGALFSNSLSFSFIRFNEFSYSVHKESSLLIFSESFFSKPTSFSVIF